jgi:hypothetical protein
MEGEMFAKVGPAELLPLLIVYAVVFGLVLGVPLGRLSQRAGYSGLLGLLGLTPITAVLLAWFLAFAPWPDREAARDQPGS